MKTIYQNEIVSGIFFHSASETFRRLFYTFLFLPLNQRKVLESDYMWNEKMKTIYQERNK